MIVIKVGGAPFNAHIKPTDADGNILEAEYFKGEIPNVQGTPTIEPGSISVASADEGIAHIGRTEGDESAVSITPVSAGTVKVSFTARNSKGETISGEQDVTVEPADVEIPVAKGLKLVEDTPAPIV